MCDFRDGSIILILSIVFFFLGWLWLLKGDKVFFSGYIIAWGGCCVFFEPFLNCQLLLMCDFRDAGDGIITKSADQIPNYGVDQIPSSQKELTIFLTMALTKFLALKKRWPNS